MLSRRAVLAAVLAMPLAARAGASITVRAPALSGTYVQLLNAHRTWSHEDWVRTFASFRNLRITTLIVQWTSIDDMAFHRASGSDKAPLIEILDLAEANHMEVVVGLSHDTQFWNQIAKPVADVEQYFADREEKTVQLVAELLPIVQAYPCFRGWYLPEEIDDGSWREPRAAAVLHGYLHRLSGYLRLVSPAAVVAISGFSNANASPDQVGQFWKDMLHAAPAISVAIFQDGIGVHKLTLDSLPGYASAVDAAAKSVGREFWAVIELFEQRQTQGTEHGGFQAVAAPFARIATQLRIESTFTTSLIAFTATDYLLSPSDPDARALLAAYLDYMHS